MVFTATFNTYLTAWIQVRWKRWMTSYYLKLWMHDGNHYKMQLTGSETDNPDQRISEDINLFITQTWTYTYSFVQNILQLGTYLVMLWDLSMTIPLIFFDRDWSFPGYFIVLAIIWAIITTFLTHKVGKPISRLTYNQQMYDANFRFSLVRVRECSEQIALLKGEEVEHAREIGEGHLALEVVEAACDGGALTLQRAAEVGVVDLHEGLPLDAVLESGAVGVIETELRAPEL